MKVDVLIVGAGLAGRNAAAEIRDSFPGLSVLAADAGGCASTEIMGFSAPANPPDSADILYSDTLRSGGGFSDPELVRLLADRALPEMRRLEEKGLVFDRTPDGGYDMVNAVGTSRPRVVHRGTTTGRAAIALLPVPVQPLEIVRLLASDGRISGAVASDGSVIAAKAVILAGGGFAGLWKFSTWSKKLRGGSLILAKSLGVPLREPGLIQFEPTVSVWPEPLAGFPIISTVLNEGGRLLDRDGRSLLSGTPPRKRELAELIQRTVDSGFGGPHGGVFYDFAEVDENTFRKKYPEYYKKFMGFVSRFQDFRIEVKPAAHTTLGGIRVNGDCSTAIAGLFAAGEAMGGLHGRDRLGGNAGLEVFVFGRIAGRSAGTFASSRDWNRIPDFECPPATPPAVYRKIGDVLDECFTVIPTREKLETGLHRLSAFPDFKTVTLVRDVFLDALQRVVR